MLQVIGEGSFSIVYKAQNLKNNKVFAVKCLKHHFDSVEQVFHFISLFMLRFKTSEKSRP